MLNLYCRKNIIYSSRLGFRLPVRHYSSLPPRASLHSDLSPVSIFWHQRFPTAYKYFSLVVASAGTLRYIHPNTLITIGPPLAVGSWFIYKWYKHSYSYKREIAKIYPKSTLEASDPNNQILMKPYDEASVENVLNGIEDEFDSFKTQILPLIESKLIDYAILKNNNPLGIFKRREDGNDEQLTCKLGDDFETFIVLPLIDKYLPYNEYQRDLMESTEGRIEFDKFIKFSVPFYSSKDSTTRKRLATVEVYLLQHVNTDSENQLYKISVELVKYGSFNRRRLLIEDFEIGGLTKSLKFNDKQDFIEI
ncbi:hypothetical protein CLIB1423_29S01090 [[Candida] railenensis]|uniref:Uncharacterized protein n=1 Tax=[Candida] railenensis TaxID=45579 RepID=A0A9P0QV87_9ASCO|nr:hypothetical protein CLIB1423_29S01090 [[Candida] railenensis]